MKSTPSKMKRGNKERDKRKSVGNQNSNDSVVNEKTSPIRVS